MLPMLKYAGCVHSVKISILWCGSINLSNTHESMHVIQQFMLFSSCYSPVPLVPMLPMLPMLKYVISSVEIILCYDTVCLLC